MQAQFYTNQNTLFNTATSPFTKVYGVGRSLLALSTLLTLVFNNYAILFSPTYHHDLNGINFFLLFGYNYLWLSKKIAILILFAVISGVYPRMTGILHWWISFSAFHAFLVVDGGDQVISVLTFFLVFITMFDERKNHWSNVVSQSTVSIYIGNLVMLLIRIQVIVLYLMAAVRKLYIPEWVNGTAEYYWLTNTFFGAPHYLMWLVHLLILNHAVIFMLTWGTILFELLLCVGIFFKPKARIQLLKAGIIFHFLIFIFMGFGSFFFAMTGSLVLYLYPPADKTNRL